jgi:putative ATP-dependent endonuclease of OLD family
MVVFQTQESDNYYPRSFEDAFIHINRDFISTYKDTFASLKNKEIIDVKDSIGKYKNDAFILANTCVKSKSSFALDILLNSEESKTSTFSNWKIPPYIEEGLLWLRKN